MALNVKRVCLFLAALCMCMLLMSACSSAGDDLASQSTDGSKNAGASTEAATGNSSAASRDDAPGSEPRPEEWRTDESSKQRAYPATVNGEVQAGQLTAGEWDDLAAWGRFKNLLNSREADQSLKVWNIGSLNRLEVIVSSGGHSLSDAEVQLLDNGQIIWTARTNREGRAYLFTGVSQSDRLAEQATFEVAVTYGKNGKDSKRVGDIDMTRQDALKIDVNTAPSETDQVDIMFVVDTTGSMEDELNYLGAELKDVVNRVAKDRQNELSIRLSANFYRDKYDDYVVRPFPFVTNVDAVIRQINEQEASGGGDYPEAVDQALRDAIHEHNWSESARARLLFLVLDAPPHSDEQVIDEMHRLIKAAAAEGIRIIPVASSGVDIDTEYLLRTMAAATGGTYLFLTDDSGIGNDHLEPAVGEYEVKLLNDLLVEVINRYAS